MKKIGSVCGIISGVISIIFAFVIKDMNIGSYESNLTYGGDAYTGIQNASAQAANNTVYLTELVQKGLFALLLVIGIALICYFVAQLDQGKAIVPVADVNNAGQQETKEDITTEVKTEEVIKETEVEVETATETEEKKEV